ncbi:unnamed protein product, partial [Parnassius apollo]
MHEALVNLVPFIFKMFILDWFTGVLGFL